MRRVAVGVGAYELKDSIEPRQSSVLIFTRTDDDKKLLSLHQEDLGLTMTIMVNPEIKRILKELIL